MSVRVVGDPGGGRGRVASSASEPYSSGSGAEPVGRPR